MTTRRHIHVPLVGSDLDRRLHHQPQVFRTALAAEYPEDLCTTWVQQFLDWRRGQSQEAAAGARNRSRSQEQEQEQEQETRSRSRSRRRRDRRTPPGPRPGVRIPGRKEARETQNTLAVGGLRNPNLVSARSRSLRACGS